MNLSSTLSSFGLMLHKLEKESCFRHIDPLNIDSKLIKEYYKQI